jgi:SSS family solute:Na+ symporter
VTLADWIGQRLGPRAAWYAGILNVLNVIPVAYSLSLGWLLSYLFGISLPASIFLGTFLVLFYTYKDGLRSVVYTDALQACLMFVSAWMVFIVSWTEWGGLDYLKNHLPASHWSLTGGHSMLDVLLWGFIAMSTLVDPNFYQRIFALAKPEKATRGILWSTLFWFFFDVATTGGALFARAYLPEAVSGEAYLQWGLQILPIGLRGLFIAGIIACIISTLDSYLHASSVTLYNNVMVRRFGERRFFLQIGLIFSAVLSSVLALYFDGSIRLVWKAFGSLSAGCLLIPLIVIMWKPHWLSERSFIVSLWTSAALMLVWRLGVPKVWLDQVPPLYLGLLGSILVIFVSRYIMPVPRKNEV